MTDQKFDPSSSSGSFGVPGTIPSPSVSMDSAAGILDPAVAPIRRAVAAHLSRLSPGDLVLCAVSGGPDSLTLAAVVNAVAPMYALRVGAVVVDHGLFEGSADIAQTAASVLTDLGLSPVVVEQVHVDVNSGVGVEAAARTARYACLSSVAATHGAATVLLGHTMDDQAETVLLGLARGSGARSISGMNAVDGIYGRPLLAVSRDVVHAAVPILMPNVSVFIDPANSDPAFLRSRIRNELMPVLESVLGHGVIAALARSADQFRADNVALEVWASIAWSELAVVDGEQAGDTEFASGVGRSVVMAVEGLAPLPDAVRRRVIRRAMLVAGVPGGAVSSEHILGVDVLVTDWRGRGPVALPGAISAERKKDVLVIRK